MIKFIKSELITLLKGIVVIAIVTAVLFTMGVVTRVWWFALKAGWNYFDLP